jgi:leucine dehydrogenase
MFEDLLREWDGEEVALRFDLATDAWMFVCVDSTVLGPAMGGARMRVYATPHDALADGLRLASAMTLKQAAADLPNGGGKAVLAVPGLPARGSEERRTLMLRYADLVSSLGGTYVTAADMNTGEPDMDVIGERCPYVLGRSRARGGSGDPGRSTGIGVFHGIVAAASHAFGSGDLTGRTVLVQGIGSVGSTLAERLGESGASLLLSDVDAERARMTADRLGAKVVAAEDAIGTECDVFAPCATGGVLNESTIPRLRCPVVAGAANNQLATPEDAARLRGAEILYAPDFVINAGGVIHLAGYETLGWDEAAMTARLEGIADTLATIFAEADRDGVTTDAAATRLARSRIAAASSTP